MSNVKTTPMQIKELMADTTGSSEMTAQPKVGSFIVFTTQQMPQGLRVNIEKIRNYASSGENEIQISYDNAGSTVLRFKTEAERNSAMSNLDSFCI